jgi:hypothetical protein
VLHVRAQVVIGRDRAGRGVHPGGRQGQAAEVGGPADGEKHGIGAQVSRCRAAAVVDADGLAVDAERLNQRVCVHVHIPGAESAAKFGRNVGVGGGYEDGSGFEQADRGAEVIENGRDLAAGVGTADDRDPPGEAVQRRDVLVREREVSAGDLEAARVTADGHDDAVGGPGARAVGSQRVRVGEADRAEVLHQVDPVSAQMAGHVLLVVGVTGHPVAVGDHDGKVRDRRRAL